MNNTVESGIQFTEIVDNENTHINENSTPILNLNAVENTATFDIQNAVSYIIGLYPDDTSIHFDFLTDDADVDIEVDVDNTPIEYTGNDINSHIHINNNVNTNEITEPRVNIADTNLRENSDLPIEPALQLNTPRMPEIGEDLASILYSYTSVMADFQTNMNLYQRNMGFAIGASTNNIRNILPPQSYPATTTTQIRNIPVHRVPISHIRRAPPTPSLRRAASRRAVDMSAFVETTTYTGAAEGTDPDTCPISLDQFVIGDNISKIRACGHSFKSAALIEWFERSNSACPICRRDVRILPGMPTPPVNLTESLRTPSSQFQSRITSQILTAIVRELAQSMHE